LDFVVLKYDGVTFLRSVENHPVSDTTSHSKRRELLTLLCFAGATNVCDDMHFMLGKRPEWYWRVTWVFFAPVILAV
jgi:hypothetical protein